MFECGESDCKMCKTDKNYLDIGEPIIKVVLNEILDEKGCRIEQMIINDKWRLIPTGNDVHPFRKEKIKDEH